MGSRNRHRLPLGIEAYNQIRANFILQGGTLGAWCKEEGVIHSNAKACLTGAWTGPKAETLRRKIVAAAGVKNASQRREGR